MKKTIVITTIILISIFLLITSNYWVFGIFSLLDGGKTKNTIRELEPLMEQYLEEKYGGEMKLWSVGNNIGRGIMGTARRTGMPEIDFFEIHYSKNEDGAYIFSDTYYNAYLKYLITNRLNEISKKIYKENFKSGFVFSASIDFSNTNLNNIDIPLNECFDIIKYNFAYSVNYIGKFDENKTDIMYELLKNVYESEILPFQIGYSFYKKSSDFHSDFMYDYVFSQSDKNGDLINYENFKEDVLEQYNKK